jgi:hypothetical protein
LQLLNWQDLQSRKSRRILKLRPARIRDLKMKKNKLLSVVIMLIITFVCFFSCEKYYDSDNIEDIRKIKELLLDADCSKGIASKWTWYSSSYGSNSSNQTQYCDTWDIDETNIEEFYKGLGNIKSVKYNRNKKTVILDCNYTVFLSWNNSFTYDKTFSFYTKKAH